MLQSSPVPKNYRRKIDLDFKLSIELSDSDKNRINQPVLGPISVNNNTTESKASSSLRPVWITEKNLTTLESSSRSPETSHPTDVLPEDSSKSASLETTTLDFVDMSFTTIASTGIEIPPGMILVTDDPIVMNPIGAGEDYDTIDVLDIETTTAYSAETTVSESTEMSTPSDSTTSSLDPRTNEVPTSLTETVLQTQGSGEIGSTPRLEPLTKFSEWETTSETSPSSIESTPSSTQTEAIGTTEPDSTFEPVTETIDLTSPRKTNTSSTSEVNIQTKDSQFQVPGSTESMSVFETVSEVTSPLFTDETNTISILDTSTQTNVSETVTGSKSDQDTTTFWISSQTSIDNSTDLDLTISTEPQEMGPTTIDPLENTTNSQRGQKFRTGNPFGTNSPTEETIEMLNPTTEIDTQRSTINLEDLDLFDTSEPPDEKSSTEGKSINPRKAKDHDQESDVEDPKTDDMWRILRERLNFAIQAVEKWWKWNGSVKNSTLMRQEGSRLIKQARQVYNDITPLGHNAKNDFMLFYYRALDRFTDLARNGNFASAYLEEVSNGNDKKMMQESSVPVEELLDVKKNNDNNLNHGSE
ncbi:hypothetical protein QAD02_006214 [Eretmocerus hayati]|uniref:Uncharacterized protein n=1 Tax=Eretmocerus hayati TaxID=131215 RepID=A0ACC2N0M3_9HYME|nr:hypothetical protein QAD02_006214 [Eretmocerus hayati]